MRLSELMGRELVDVRNGEKIGQLAKADLLINRDTGQIEQLILPGSSWTFSKKTEEQNIPWKAIQKIGTDMILIELPRYPADSR